MFYFYQILQYLISPFYKCFQPSFRKGIWIHASSVGEVNASSGLIKKLRRKYTDIPVLLTVFTESGMRHAKKVFEKEGLVEVQRFPGDFTPYLSRVLDEFMPMILILVETELWPNLILQAKRRSVPVIIVNARLSDKYKRYKIFGGSFLSLINRIDRIFAINEFEATKFNRLGIPWERIEVVGNLKFDFSARLPEQRGLNLNKSANKPIVTFGSIRSKEEDQVIEVLTKIIQHGVKVVIAPRHLSRVKVIVEKLKKVGIKCTLRTKYDNEGWDVMLLDTLGELLDFYAISEIAFVGGTLAPYGGHNLIEPALFGIPVLFGPYVSNVLDIAKGLIRNGGAFMVKDKNDLAEKIIELLTHHEARKLAGKRAEHFVRKNLNITKTIVNRLEEYIKNAR